MDERDEIFGILVPVTFVGFLITERLFPRREYPPIRFWNLIGFAVSSSPPSSARGCQCSCLRG